MIGELIFLAVSYSFHVILLFVGLWVMLKIQKFNYNWPGLIGSALLASGLDMIPYFGHALAVPALYICVWKMTRESIFPDAAFTVLFSYLFMFVVNMFLLTYLTGDLRPDLHPDTDRAGDTAPTNAIVAAPTNPPAASAAADSAAAKKAAEAAAKNLSVKGVIRSGAKSMLMLGDGKKIHTLALGEKTKVQTPGGSSWVQFDRVDTNSVTLLIDGTPVELALP